MANRKIAEDLGADESSDSVAFTGTDISYVAVSGEFDGAAVNFELFDPSFGAWVPISGMQALQDQAFCINKPAGPLSIRATTDGGGVLTSINVGLIE